MLLVYKICFFNTSAIRESTQTIKNYLIKINCAYSKSCSHRNDYLIKYKKNKKNFGTRIHQIEYNENSMTPLFKS